MISHKFYTTGVRREWKKNVNCFASIFLTLFNWFLWFAFFICLSEPFFSLHNNSHWLESPSRLQFHRIESLYFVFSRFHRDCEWLFFLLFFLPYSFIFLRFFFNFFVDLCYIEKSKPPTKLTMIKFNGRKQSDDYRYEQHRHDVELNEK